MTTRETIYNMVFEKETVNNFKYAERDGRLPDMYIPRLHFNGAKPPRFLRVVIVEDGADFKVTMVEQ